MSTLITKANKARSQKSQKLRATKAKKAASRKPQRPGKITAAPKSKKAAPVKAKKPASSATKKALSKKKSVKTPVTKTAKKVVAKKPTGKGVAVKSRKPIAKAPQPPLKAPPAPGALAAVRAFEHALKSFNRHDFAAAKAAFEGILQKFSEQAEIVARARTYLAICEHRLARAPSIPRNPDALYNQGVFELNKGSVRQAIDLFEKALRADPRADYVLYSLAAAYARLNDVPKAMDALRRAISIRPVHRSHARRDLDFTGLRANEDFQHLTGFGFDFIEE